MAMSGSQRPDLLGHPRGLAYIAFTEAWERFSFYGMQALLVLYMTGHLLQPGTIDGVAGFAVVRGAIESVTGPLSVQALATQIFGLYVGLIYFTPIIGGAIGDRVTGRKVAVLAGAVLMAVGHFLMAFEAAFLAALAALIIGAGLLKGNLAAQVGNLYAKDDIRRDRAYTLYMIAINVGAFVAPLVCGTLGELYGWHYGFGAAGIGMVIGLAIYVAGLRYLPGETKAVTARVVQRLTPRERKTVAALFLVLALTSLFWIPQAQVWNTYPLWQQDFVERGVLSFTVPVTWFQSIDSLAMLAVAPVVMMLWRRQSRRGAEPGDVVKIALGCVVYAGAFLLLSAGQIAAGEHKVAVLWPLAFHLTCAVGYVYAAPNAMALISRAAPPAVNATMVGAYSLGIFVGGIASGWLGRFYEPLQPAGFWALHAAIALAGGALYFLFRRALEHRFGINGSQPSDTGELRQNLTAQ